jgi:hypothetical protein
MDSTTSFAGFHSPRVYGHRLFSSKASKNHPVYVYALEVRRVGYLGRILYWLYTNGPNLHLVVLFVEKLAA